MLKPIFLLLFGILSAVAVRAVDEPVIVAPLEGRLGQLLPNATAEVKDNDFFDDLNRSPKKYTSTVIKNILTFSIDEGSPVYLKAPFIATLTYRLYYHLKSSPEEELSISEDQVLEIHYDTSTSNAYKLRTSFIFEDAVKVRVQIVGVTTTASGWDPVQALRFTNEMRISRVYAFDCEINKVAVIQYTAPQPEADELEVSWIASEGADEYDLEWAYIDNTAYNSNRYGMPGSAAFEKNIFKNNASRVTLTYKTPGYKIPLLYENDGLLFFRIRAVQVAESGRRTETHWSHYNSFEYTAGHQPHLNWQSSTAFAEEGKRKSLLQYFDGSLRNRQSVTKDNSSNTIVVAESMYDYQGRPVIQVLPSPTINSVIKYTPRFNHFINSSAYYKDNYDKILPGNDDCYGAAPALDPAKGGTAQYYSPLNPEKDEGNNKLIPDANGFPFTETKYLRDNTGRIAAQSGVGAEHRLGSGHETKYYYGNPDQSELDALFGTEAGNASHYFKNMVRDANGQYSVSYLDMHGRTIATALAGDLPPTTRLDYLPSKQNGYLVKTLTSPSNNIVNGLVIESSKGLLVTQKGEHQFTYSLLPENVDIQNCSAEDVCYSCSYNLEITIRDDCGNKQFGGTPYVYKEVVGNISAACANLPALFTLNFNKVLEEGSYTVTKRLTIRNEAIAQYQQTFAGANLCKTVQDFVQEQKNIFLEATNNCATPCTSCRTQLGNSEQEFTTKFLTDNQLDAQSPSDQELARATYQKLLKQCGEMCAVAPALNYPDQLRILMLQDVTPPYGQYADLSDFEMTGGQKLYFKYGIFGRVSENSSQLRYTIASIPYKDANGKAAVVTVMRNGQLMSLRPQQLTVEEFAGHFQPSWAEALVDNLHPEILKYNILTQTPITINQPAVGRDNYEWDRDFITTETFAEAMQKGYLNPTGNPAFTAKHPRHFTPMPAHGDPFFSMHNLQRNQMHNYMNKVASGGGTDLDIWMAASVSAFCNDQNDLACMSVQIATPFGTDACDADLDMAWRAFRAMYKAKKDSLIRVMVNSNTYGAPYLDPQKYHSYFAEPHSIITANTGINDLESKAGVNAALENFYTDGNTCTGYSELWWNKLTPCDTLKLQAYKTQILADLIMVCQKGTDTDHIMGASSIAPGATHTFRDFDEVLAHYRQLYNNSNPNDPISLLDCNGSLLNFPASYNTPGVVANKPVITRPEACECERIAALHTAFEQEQMDPDFAAYIFRTLQTVISNGALDTLMGLCNYDPRCRNLGTPLFIPTALQCGMDAVCVPCNAVAEAYNDFSVRYPGYLPAIESATEQQGKINELFGHFMNRRFGFNKYAQEYLAFMDSCAFNDRDTERDSLLALKDRYNRDKNPLRVRVILQSNSLNPTVYDDDIGKSISDGVLRWPQEIRDTARGYFEYFQHVVAGSRYCFENGYAIEFRFKFLKNDIRDGEEFFYYTDPNGEFVLYRRASGPVERQGIFLLRIRGIDPETGKKVNINNDVTLISNDPDLIFKEWTDMKFEISPDHFSVYANNILLREVPSGGAPLTNWGGFTLCFMHFQAALDWTRIYDHNGKQVFFDDYLSNNTRQIIDPSFLCPQPAVSCEQAFTAYFNQQRGSGYSFKQIDSLYRLITGYPVDVCTVPDFGKADSLRRLTDSFYMNVKPGIVTHSLNTQEGQRLTGLDQIVENGVVQFPDSIRVQPGESYNNYQFDFVAFCTNNGYSIESRFKFLQNVLDGDIFYLGFRSIQPVFFRDPAGLYISRVDLYGYNNAGYPTVTIPLNRLVDTSAYAVLNWMTIKAVIKPDKYELYYNDKKVFEYNRDPSVPIGNQENFGLGLRGRQGAVDWVRVGDVNDKTMFFEDYNDLSHPATVKTDFICKVPSDCQAAFAHYFNRKQQTNYTYQEIESIYKLAGAPLDACEPRSTPVANTGRLLCGNTTPTAIPIEARVESPCVDSLDFAVSRGYERFTAYRDSLIGEFNQTFINKCLRAVMNESFTVSQPVSEYHYTLYYYDQAGNLVKTVPPAGVRPNYDADWLQQVRDARLNTTVTVPAHEMTTQYRYNSLNKIVQERSPDAGKSKFWHDRLGRLAISQNAQQAKVNEDGPGVKYSYTRYDYLGRITEVGQINDGSADMSFAVSRDPRQLQAWMNKNIASREQVTLTIYDQPAKESYLHKDLSPYILRERSNLRNRVSFTVFSRQGDLSDYDHAAFYNYDIHGNVDTLLQDYGATGFMAQNGGRYKRVAYTYDLISGKINMVSYQPRLFDPVTKQYIIQQDAFYHQYAYDAENRLTDVYTSSDQVHWEHDAYYSYYKHGPLSRMVLGDQQVQGLDYAYTLQGWLKGVNSTAVGSGIYDAGLDGLSRSPNHWVARDAFGFSLQYFDKDYMPVQNTGSLVNITTALRSSAKPLYNGNISGMAVNIPALGDARVYAYSYDQLNRITGMDAYGGLNNSNNTFSPVVLDDYRERVSYDANGNILTYKRNGNKSGTKKQMDDLTYNYKPSTNQLKRVQDAIPAGYYTGDLDNQPANNYDYDAIGNLIQDKKEGIEEIKWTMYGRIGKIAKTDGTIITYTYDAAGNRIGKNVNGRETWYVRDAQGNTLSVYEQNSTVNNGHFTQSELHLYGSSRLGILNRNQDLTLTPAAPVILSYGNTGSLIIFERNKKLFELTNHLGNVLATVSDKKTGVSNSNNTIDYYTANVRSAQDYYPFGMQMPGRTFRGGAQDGTLSNTEGYRYGFNGKESDKEITPGAQDYGMRIYDSRVARFLSVDPLTKQYPELTPYQFASNRSIDGIDQDGLEVIQYTLAKQGVYGPTVAKLSNGYEDGVKASVKKTWSFVTSDAWKARTWRETGLLLGEMATKGSPSTSWIPTPRVDAVVQGFEDNVINGDAYSRAKYLSEVGTDLLLAKGVSKGFTVTRGMALTEKIAARSNFAKSFYESVGGNVRDVSGINLSEKVSAVGLNTNTKLYQWTIDGKLGDYFSPTKNGKNLGLPQMPDGTPAYFDRATNTLKPRTLVEVNLPVGTELKGLKSTASDIKPWDGASGMNKGGDIQIFSPQVKTSNPTITPIQ